MVAPAFSVQGGVIGVRTPVKRNLYGQIRCLLRQYHPLRLRRERVLYHRA